MNQVPQPERRGGKTPAAPSSATPGEARQAVVERVIQEALLPPGADCWSEEDRAVIRVARRYRGQPFGLNPVAVELVLEVACAFFRVREVDRDHWRGLSEAVAATLCEDPVCHSRLESLWQRFCESDDG